MSARLSGGANSLTVYHLTNDAIHEIPETSFAARGVRERGDLQRLLMANIAVVDADVLVISEEFCEWDDSRRRIDLLGVDADGSLVIIELKRDDDSHMELQAIRYAAMVAGMTFARAVEVYQAFLQVRGVDLDARASLLAHLKWDEPREDGFAKDVRIVLVAGEFSKELTTAVIWLNERNLDIRCVRMKPYVLDDRTIVDVQQVVPLPEAQDYQIRVRAKDQAVRAEGAERHQLRRAFWTEFLPVAAQKNPRFANRKPTDFYSLGTSSGYKGLSYYFCIWQHQCGFEFYIDLGEELPNKTCFDRLHAKKEEIERVYGGRLGWERLDDKRACRIFDDSIPGGIRTPREEWPRMRDAMIASMQRFEQSIVPHLEASVAVGVR